MSSLVAAVLVFLSSASVLVLELLAGRLLAPYVGVTLQSFTGIIGVVLAGIALGSWLGGRLADRRDPRTLIGPLLVLGGVLAFASIPIIDTLGPGVQRATPMVIVAMTTLAFFLPSTVLSAVSPAVVKLRLDDLDDTGKVVGALSGIGTAGALVGTFVTGFVLVAAAPTRPVIRGVSVFLVLLGLWAWWQLRGTVSVTPGATFAGLAIAGVSLLFRGPCEYESAYFCAQVIEDPDRPSGRLLRLDTLRHSYVDLDDPTHLEFSYTQTLSDVLAVTRPDDEALDVLHVGGGGFSIPRWLQVERPGTTSVVLELDPLLVDIATDELGLVQGPDLRVITGDARRNILDQPEDAYDLVIGDAFGGISVPWHLTTVEFLTDVRTRLRPGGLYALNMIDYADLGFARAEAATLLEVFERVVVMAPPGRLDGSESGGNFVMVASDGPIPVDAFLERNAARGDDEAAITGAALDAWIGDATVLTDDFAPVDQLLTPYPERRRG